ncbi:hypothetical protein [Streptomyces atriruber]|uniref:hypothetical protein n=1 Tax=Streptomyces atriruber TaxID=545121 RepID=UPI0006E397B2|nr:hypothetical protein [Streptomyces atriruber]
MSTPNPFAQPGRSGDFFSPKHHREWLGRLFIFYPESTVMKTFKEDEGPKPFVIADVVIVDLPDPQTGQPTVMHSTTIGGTSLVPALDRDNIGKKVLGRLRQNPPQGQRDGAYYIAGPGDPEGPTDQDIAVAAAYDAQHPRQVFAPPQAQQAPPAQQYGQPQNVTQMPGYGGPQAQPQHVSQQLPYDPWQGTQAAPGGQPQAGPPQGQWGTPPAGQQPSQQGAPSNAAATAAPAGAAPGSPQWGAPAASAQAAPAPTPPVSASAALDPQLVAFLQSKGVNAEGMTVEQATLIANTLQAQKQAPPF